MTASSMISHCENSFQIANFLMSNADLSEKPLDELPSAQFFESVQLFSPVFGPVLRVEADGYDIHDIQM